MYNIVLVGAGGAGVSSLGGLLLELGYTNIIATDKVDSCNLQTLKKGGAATHIGHGHYAIQQGDIVIYSAATTQTPEVQQAFALHEENYKKAPPPMLFHECMGEISKYFRTIAVTGTHGKSSTSSLCAAVIQQCTDDFGVAIIGAQLTDREGKSHALNQTHQKDIRTIFDHIFFRKGQPIGSLMKKLRFVIEADEYNKHFLFLDPDYALITTCELDHLDTYGTEDNYFHTFYEFMQRVRYDIFVPADDQGIQKLLAYSEQQPGSINPVDLIETTHYEFKYMIGGHNHSNASLVSACLEKIGCKNTVPLINEFRGILRRAELLGENKHNVPVYSDYGHHPTELASTIDAFRDHFPKTPIHVLFQPHQMARIVQSWDQFHASMVGQTTEHRAYAPIYAARETVEGCRDIFPLDGDLGKTEGVKQLHTVNSSEELSLIFAQQSSAPLLEGNTDVYERIDNIDQGVIVFFSAGSLDKVIREYIKK